VQQQEVADKISVTDDEAQAYYAANSQTFTTPSEITLREVLIEVPVTDKGINVAQDEEAKGKAEDVRKRLLAGEPFARLAAEVSDSPSKANGGLIGPFKMTDVAPALQKAIDPLKVGDVSEPIRTQRGYQLLKVETKTAANVQSFEAARNQIVDRVGGEKLRVETLKYLDKLRGQAIVQWRNAELQKAYELALEKRRQVLGPVA
jgi:parvulin-like peptidyl-prolyl isomerase